jgi:hypothetical protein
VRHHGAYSSALNHLRRALGLPRVDMAEMAHLGLGRIVTF